VFLAQECTAMFADLLGVTGIFMILLAYFLNVTGNLETRLLWFIVLHLVGVSLACAASILRYYLPFIMLEEVRALISFFFFAHYLKKE
jgi:hypothetical protein